MVVVGLTPLFSKSVATPDNDDNFNEFLPACGELPHYVVARLPAVVNAKANPSAASTLAL